MARSARAAARVFFRGGGCCRAVSCALRAGGRADGRGRGGVGAGRGVGGHRGDAAEGAELRHVELDRVVVAQVRPRAEEGGGRDDERRELQDLILCGARTKG